MPPRSNPKGILLWSLLTAQLVGALQQHSSYNAYPSKAGADEVPDGAAAMEHRWESVAAAADSLHNPPLSGQRGFRDTYVDKTPRASSYDERALATLSPAEANNPAVRAPPAPRSSAATAGISSRQPARSLRDWQVEDIMLLATVDGKLHARDRKTGAPRWALETDWPMVQTIYHNKTAEAAYPAEEDPLWIVEPSQGGSIYLYFPQAEFGMKKLDYTVKELVELTPYYAEGHPAVTYTGEKRTTLYTVDASTGNILKTFSATGTFSNDDRSCRAVSPFKDALEDDECKPIGTITLSRTEYIIGITDGNRPITTIHYTEWGTNNRDHDLQSKYVSTMDNKYVYTRYDGKIFGLDLALNEDYEPPNFRKATYMQALDAPVVRVFDIVRPHDDMSSDAALVILPQPIAPPMVAAAGPDQHVFVDCTENGSWYALSELSYPGVTKGAAYARLYDDEMFQMGLPFMNWPPSLPQREKFTGVHEISHTVEHGGNLIDGQERPSIDPPPTEGNVVDVVNPPTSRWDTVLSVRTLLLATVVTMVVCGAGGAFYGMKMQRPVEVPIPEAIVQQPVVEDVVVPDVPLPTADDPPAEREPVMRVVEPEQEIIFPHHPDEPSEPAGETAERVDDFEVVEMPKEAVVEEVDDANVPEEILNEKTASDNKGQEANVTKKKKSGAHRGKRGGRKNREKEEQQAEARATKAGLEQSPEPEPQPEPQVQPQVQPQTAAPVIVEPELSLVTSRPDSAKIIGPLQINSLIINTDRVIGQGSCGTSVFEGSFEGRAVAVKRMLSQYYELASQEVSFLQQSDDHPNVVRYFCQQKDDHFLYIAVELCQASLFEVWEPEKARTDQRQQQLQSLKFTILQDPPKALQQLAAGLYHLHNLRIIHRDIKPQNILVAFPKKNQNNGPRLVISDFGLGKNLPENVSTLVDPTGNAGTSGWKAPELISQPRETDSRHSQQNSHTGGSENAAGSTSGVKRAADIFSLGCLFFWVLTDGIHPYEDENGWQQLRELNIKRDHKKMGVLERWSDAYEPMQLITSMLAHQPEDRPTALQVLNHPFFWPPAKRLAFLCDCSDHFEREPRGTWDDYYEGDSYYLRMLEDRAEEVIGAPFEYADFLGKLDRHFVDTLGKQRKYSGNRLLDLLRALRNKKNHYEDMPEEVKRRVGALPAGYLNFWCHRFPRLLMACYQVIHEAGLERNDRFRGYFVSGNSS